MKHNFNIIQCRLLHICKSYYAYPANPFRDSFRLSGLNHLLFTVLRSQDGSHVPGQTTIIFSIRQQKDNSSFIEKLLQAIPIFSPLLPSSNFIFILSFTILLPYVPVSLLTIMDHFERTLYRLWNVFLHPQFHQTFAYYATDPLPQILISIFVILMRTFNLLPPCIMATVQCIGSI